MVEYFDDMWFALEQELSTQDNYLSDQDWLSNAPSSTMSDGEMRADPFNEPQDKSILAPATYEEFLNIKEPTNDQLRSKSRTERIEAVRQLYNQIPTIINASALANAHRVANKLYRTGKVREANKLVAEAEKTINKSFTYIDSDDTYEKSIDVHSNNGELTANVQIVDKLDDSTIRKTFSNVLEAVKFFLNPGNNQKEE